MLSSVLLRKAVLVLNLTLKQSHISLLSTSSLEAKGLPEATLGQRGTTVSEHTLKE